MNNLLNRIKKCNSCLDLFKVTWALCSNRRVNSCNSKALSLNINSGGERYLVAVIFKTGKQDETIACVFDSQSKVILESISLSDEGKDKLLEYAKQLNEAA